MADHVELSLCILWEEELRTAARLLHRSADESLSEEDRNEAAVQGFSAAMVALWGLTDDRACVLIGSDEIRKARKRRAPTQPAEPAK